MTKESLSNKFFEFLSLIRFWSPTGYILLFIPCALGTGLHGNIYENYGLVILFFFGSVIMRSAGCIVNDYWDINIDNKVERTRNRPLTSGALSAKEAGIALLLLLMLGLVILTQLSAKAVILGFFAAIMAIVYPLMKRITFWPQLFLGLTYNLGILIAVAHMNQGITLASILAYCGAVFWTIYYDSIYAFMDIVDDKKIGVKSSAIALEKKNYSLYLALFASAAVFLIMNSLILSGHNLYIVTLTTILSFALIMWQITTLDIDIPRNCLIRFKSNNYLGAMWVIASLI